MREPRAEQEILDFVDLYSNQVLATRHREVALRGRKCRANIMHTLLGFEVKAGRKRITCPDLITARYLKVFAGIGLATVRIPYDPTVTKRLVSQVEGAIERIDKASGPAPESSRKAYRRLRQELRKAEQERVGGRLVNPRSP